MKYSNKKDQNGTTPHQNQGTENTAEITSVKCCTRDFLDTCGVAVLFLHFKNSRSDTENENCGAV